MIEFYESNILLSIPFYKYLLKIFRLAKKILYRDARGFHKAYDVTRLIENLRGNRLGINHDYSLIGHNSRKMEEK